MITLFKKGRETVGMNILQSYRAAIILNKMTAVGRPLLMTEMHDILGEDSTISTVYILNGVIKRMITHDLVERAKLEQLNPRFWSYSITPMGSDIQLKYDIELAKSSIQVGLMESKLHSDKIANDLLISTSSNAVDVRLNVKRSDMSTHVANMFPATNRR